MAPVAHACRRIFEPRAVDWTKAKKKRRRWKKNARERQYGIGKQKKKSLGGYKFAPLVCTLPLDRTYYCTVLRSHAGLFVSISRRIFNLEDSRLNSIGETKRRLVEELCWHGVIDWKHRSLDQFHISLYISKLLVLSPRTIPAYEQQ